MNFVVILPTLYADNVAHEVSFECTNEISVMIFGVHWPHIFVVCLGTRVGLSLDY